MKTLQEWLDRKKPGPKARKPIPRMKKKRRGENAYYLKKRVEFLSRHNLCACSMVLFGVAARATEIHHKAGRIGANYLDESTWLPVCRKSHTWIHQNPSKARERGWMK